MGKSQETFNKKAVRNKKEKKRKDKEEKRARKKSEGKSTFDDMIAYVDEFGMLSSEPPDPDKRTEVDAGSIDLSMTRNEDNEDNDGRRTGVISFFNIAKGFGFVTDKETGERIFVHSTGLLEPVNENDVVVFDTTKGPRGLSAINVKVVAK